MLISAMLISANSILVSKNAMTINEAQNNIVDNFSFVEKYIHEHNEKDEWGDSFYYVTIQQRKKDNDDIKERVRYIRTYEIFSAAQLESLKQEIVFYCNRYNARAYILLNPRSLNVVDFYTDRDFKLKRHAGYERDFNAGRQLDVPNRPVAHIDIDSENEYLQKSVLMYLRQNEIEPLYVYRTPNNGMHIVIPNKDIVRAKKLDFTQFGSDVKGNRGNEKFNNVDMLADRPIILYANTTSKGYDELNQKYADMIARHPNIGRKTINEEQLRSYIKKTLLETIDEINGEDVNDKIYRIITDCIQKIHDWNTANDNGDNLGNIENIEVSVTPSIRELLSIIQDYGLKPEDYNSIIDSLPIPMADKMNFYYNDLVDYIRG